ncbi:Uncharacterised protein [uncultured archaeon]|nr:Uncharacterised protein [uncultured archaeon]
MKKLMILAGMLFLFTGFGSAQMASLENSKAAILPISNCSQCLVSVEELAPDEIVKLNSAFLVLFNAQIEYQKVKDSIALAHGFDANPLSGSNITYSNGLTYEINGKYFLVYRIAWATADIDMGIMK